MKNVFHHYKVWTKTPQPWIETANQEKGCSFVTCLLDYILNIKYNFSRAERPNRSRPSPGPGDRVLRVLVGPQKRRHGWKPHQCSPSHISCRSFTKWEQVHPRQGEENIFSLHSGNMYYVKVRMLTFCFV